MAFTTLMLGAIGCGYDGPELANVHGVVKLDGTPLEGATVNFYPEKGRPSMGTTNANGEFELKYTSEEHGATLGKHTVRITTYEEFLDEQDNVAKKPERIPTKYNSKSTLTREVISGDNPPFDFDLDSNGEILQPDEAELAAEAEEAAGDNADDRSID